MTRRRLAWLPGDLLGFLLAILLGASAACADEPRPLARIPLQVNTAPGTRPPAGWPVSTGIPFAEGQLTDQQIGALRLATDAGRVIPAQFEVRGRYPRSKSIRWLGVAFQLQAGSKHYRLMLEGGPGPKLAQPAQPVRVAKEDDAFLVTTGDLKVEIPRRGGMLRRVWLKGELVLEQKAGHGNWLTTTKGARHSEQGLQAEIEREGPLHSTVRVTGRYVDDQGRPSCKWSAALHFYAGRPEIEITHTFTWVGHSDDLQIKDLALTFGLKEPATSAMVDKTHEIGDGAHEGALKDGGMLSLLQDDLWHHGHGQNHFAISAGTPEQPREIAQGERGGCWISGTGARHSVLLAFRDLWQQFPKELRVTPGEMTAYLWSTKGRAPAFDLRPAAMGAFFGKDFSQFLQQEQWITNRLANRLYQDPTGMAKTHDLLLRFEPRTAAGADLQAQADAFDNVPLAYPDPEWTWRSGVAGNLGPKDEARFPEIEQALDHEWDLALGAVAAWGDYGFLFHGDGPHQSYLRTQDGVLRATPHRFGSCYGISKAAWLAYLRGGERRLHEYAFAHSRFFNDVCFSHENTASRIKGDASLALPLPWVGWPMDQKDFMTGKHPVKANYHPIGFTFYVEHALFYYYLTGDPRGLEIVKDYAGALKEHISSIPNWDKLVAGYVGAEWSRGFAHRLGDLVVLYEQLHDPWFLDQAHRVARHLIDLDRPAGIRHWPVQNGGKEPAPYPRYIFYLAPHLMRYLRVLPEGDDAELVKKALVKMAEFELRIERFHWGNGDLMAKAFELTNDPVFLAHGMKRLRRDAAIAAAQGPLERRPGLMGIGEAVLGHAVEYTAAIVGALRDHPDLPLPADTRVLQKGRLAPASEMVFEKQAGESLRIELVAQGESYADTDGKPFPAEWTRRSITYHAAEWDVPLVYREVVVPAEARAGEYRIKFDRISRGWVLRTSARRFVLAAPHGFEIEGRTGLPWYFQVPTDAKTLTVRASSFNGLVIQDSSGRPVVPKLAGDGSATLAVPKGESGVFWSIRAQNTVTVLVEGAPVFAYADLKQFFVPRVLPASADRDLPATEAAKVYREGFSGKGIQVNGNDLLSIPVGRKTANDRYENLHLEEGTIEFRFKPNWTTGGLLPYGTTRPILAFQSGKTEKLSFVFRQDGSLPRVFVLRQSAKVQSRIGSHDRMWWQRDQWTHVALVWKGSGSKQSWAIYVNGEGGGRVHTAQANLPLTFPDVEALLIGADPESGAALDGVIDDLRISSVARYNGATISPPKKIEVDAQTLACFAFEESTTGIEPGGKKVEAAFADRPAGK